MDLDPFARDLELLDQVLDYQVDCAVPLEQSGDDARHRWPPCPTTALRPCLPGSCGERDMRNIPLPPRIRRKCYPFLLQSEQDDESWWKGGRQIRRAVEPAGVVGLDD